MPTVGELIPARLEDLAPNTFIAVDVDNPEDGSDEGSSVRFVGTFLRWSGPTRLQSMILQDPNDGREIDILRYSIDAVWWAPMGYRP